MEKTISTQAFTVLPCGSGDDEEGAFRRGTRVVLLESGLPLIFDHAHKQGLRPGNDCADRLLETVRVYHAIELVEETHYRDALAAAYREFCDTRAKSSAASR